MRRIGSWNLFLLLLAGLAVAPGASPPFVEGSAEAGLSSFRLVSGTDEKKYIVEFGSAGICLLDYDSDGKLDIYLVNGGTLDGFVANRPSGLRNALFRNLGQRRFEDATESAGVAGNGNWGMGCSVTDYNNDGRPDLYVTNYGSNILYQNLGGGVFRDVTQEAGADDTRWSTGSAWADYDLDGDLDLFVANYIDLDRENLPEPGSPGYGAMGGVGLGCQYLGLKVMCGPMGLKGAGDSFFVNRGDGAFEESSRRLGLDDAAGLYGLGAVWSDLDGDGYPDLYVANDSTPNYLYRNLSGKGFEEQALPAGAAVSEQGTEQAGMGVAVGDYLNEGKFSLYVTNFSGDYNTLYHNDGDLNFSDVTARVGLSDPTRPYVGWGTVFLDYDLDGWLDLFVANGHVFPQVDQLRNRSVDGYREKRLLFRNMAGKGFALVPDPLAQPESEVSRGLAAGDLDNDGRLDVVIANIGSSPSLLWNQGGDGNHFLLIQLRGGPGNRLGVGATVRVRSGHLWQSREVRSGGGYLSQDDLRLHFGLGKTTRVDEIKVRWPDGTTSSFTDVAADQIFVIDQGSPKSYD